MKKYDIILLALYIVTFGSVYCSSRYGYLKDEQLRNEFCQIADNQDIKAVEIDNVESNIEVFYAKEGAKSSWKMRGYLDQYKIENIYIKDSVLHIENLRGWSLTHIKIRRDIPIEIRNSPNVKILSDEELAKTITDKQTRRQYEF